MSSSYISDILSAKCLFCLDDVEGHVMCNDVMKVNLWRIYFVKWIWSENNVPESGKNQMFKNWPKQPLMPFMLGLIIS